MGIEFEPLSLIIARVILDRLASFEGNRIRTAESLGMSIRAFRNHLKRYAREGYTVPPNLKSAYYVSRIARAAQSHSAHR